MTAQRKVKVLTRVMVVCTFITATATVIMIDSTDPVVIASTKKVIAIAGTATFGAFIAATRLAARGDRS